MIYQPPITLAALDGLTISTGTALAFGGGLVTCISALFALLMKSKEREYERVVADLNESKENFEKLAAESLTFATQQANWAMEKQNLPPIVLRAPVVPRSQSPSTAKQRETARLDTMVATLAQLKLMMGIHAAPIPPRAPQTEAEAARENLLEEIATAPHSISPQVVVSPSVLSAAAPKQILVIEDDPGTCELMLARSGNMNCRLSFAGDGVKGLKIAMSQNWHAILVDIGLPGISGFEVIRTLRQGQPQFVHLVAISGVWTPEMLRELKRSGCLLFVTKPEDFTPEFFDNLWRTFGVDPISQKPATRDGPRNASVAELTQDWAESNRVRAAASATLTKAIAEVPDKVVAKMVESRGDLSKAIEAVPDKTAVKVVEKIEQTQGPKKL